MFGRITALIIGYFFGNILTAEIVVRAKTGKSAREFGTGNPGMANVMQEFGFRAGLTVLAGDLAKTLAACLIAYFLLGGASERIIVYYAGLGATVGHNYPFWKKFRGGLGVATTCNACFLYSPLAGLLCAIAGLAAVLVTQYLCIGAVVIPFAFCITAFVFFGREAGVISLVLLLMMIIKHGPAIVKIPSGRVKRIDLISKIKPGKK